MEIGKLRTMFTPETAKEITVLYYRKWGYLGMFVYSGSTSEAAKELYRSEGIMALCGKSKPSLIRGLNYHIPLN